MSFDYSTGYCANGWRVARNKVISIWVTPKPHQLLFKNLNLNLKTLQKVQDKHVSYFSDAERKRIRQAFDKVKSDRCRKWFEETIKSLGQPDLSVDSQRPKTMDKLIEYAEFNKYDPKLTAQDMRISQDRRKKIADNYENAWTNFYIANAVTLGPDYTRIYLMPSAFWQDSTVYNWSGRDLSGIITFELLHVAGFGDDKIWSYRDALQRHCGDPSDNL